MSTGAYALHDPTSHRINVVLRIEGTCTLWRVITSNPDLRELLPSLLSVCFLEKGQVPVKGDKILDRNEMNLLEEAS